MRSLVVPSLLLLSVAPASAEPGLATAEVRLAYGLAAGGGSGRATVRGSPLVLTAAAALAVRDQPRISAHAGLLVETLDRTGAGGEAGLTLTPRDDVRLRAGVVAVVTPYTIWGAAAGGGSCRPLAGSRICVDLTANVLVGGTDLPSGSAVLQLLVGLGVIFDAS